jgi:hypothetical protein
VGVLRFQAVRLPSRARGRVGALLIAAGLVSGCQTAPGLAGRAGEDDPKAPRDLWGRSLEEPVGGALPPSFDPVVLPRPEGTAEDPDLRQRRDLSPDEQGWAEKLAVARALLEAGEDDQAVTVIDAALAAGAPTATAIRLRALRLEVRSRRTEEDVLRVEARPTKDVAPFGVDLEFLVRLRNVGSQPIVFGSPQADRDAAGRALPGGALSSPNAVTLEVVRRDRDASAALLERRWNTTVHLQRPGDPPLRIGPGQHRDFPVRIPAAAVGPPIAGVRIVELSGVLRPSRMTVGGQPEALPLRVRKGRMAVLPDGHEPLAVDPLRSLEQAVSLGAAPHVLVAMEFVPRSGGVQAAMLLARGLAEGDGLLARAAQGGLAMLRERCVGDPLAPLVAPLAASLEARPERSRELVAGLMELTDERLPADARLWLDWCRRLRGSKAVVEAPHEPGAPDEDAIR